MASEKHRSVEDTQCTGSDVVSTIIYICLKYYILTAVTKPKNESYSINFK